MANELIAVFLFGLIIGSFLNVLIFRVNDLKSVINSRSHCPNCRHQLAWYDLIPLVSFLLLKARCRYCKEKISWQYPLVELGTAVVLSVIFTFWGLSWDFVFYGIIFSLLIVVFVHDLKTQMVPDEFVWAALILSLIGGGYFSGLGFANSLLGLIIGGGVFAALVFISKEQWMGSGDIKIGMILGALLGYPRAIVGLFLAFVLGGVIGLIFIGLKKKTLKDALPFAPFLIFSILITLLYGDWIVRWYIGTLS